jgi:hypothetical protein
MREMDTDPHDEQGPAGPDQGAEPTMTDPDDERPSSNHEGLQPDPGAASPHGDPITDIDDELRTGGDGND